MSSSALEPVLTCALFSDLPRNSEKSVDSDVYSTNVLQHWLFQIRFCLERWTRSWIIFGLVGLVAISSLPLLAISSPTHLLIDVPASSSMPSLVSWWLKVLFMEIPLKIASFLFLKEQIKDINQGSEFLFHIYSYYMQCLTGVLVLTHQNLHQKFKESRASDFWDFSCTVFCAFRGFLYSPSTRVASSADLVRRAPASTWHTESVKRPRSLKTCLMCSQKRDLDLSKHTSSAAKKDTKKKNPYGRESDLERPADLSAKTSLGAS